MLRHPMMHSSVHKESDEGWCLAPVNAAEVKAKRNQRPSTLSRVLMAPHPPVCTRQSGVMEMIQTKISHWARRGLLLLNISTSRQSAQRSYSAVQSHRQAGQVFGQRCLCVRAHKLCSCCLTGLWKTQDLLETLNGTEQIKGHNR